jgi:hypothetical protein
LNCNYFFNCSAGAIIAVIVAFSKQGRSKNETEEQNTVLLAPHG